MELKQEMITIDCAEPGPLAAWWANALGVEIAQDFGEFVMVAAQPLVLGFQRVPEERAGKNRVHVDFSTADRTAAVERLVALGAKVVAERDVPGLNWTTMQDPEGNEFCVSG
ncbi:MULTISPECIES: VOC family protein [unclassified Embleya]|uniref:VOC family protein n=1 Tax=unclassified Embleya TaxID=2699296 RepID=UPI0033FB2B07